MSHSAENFRRGIVYCCINFGYRKSLDKRGGEYPRFLSKIFCLTVPKISVRESFVALISGTEENWRRGGGEYQDFPSTILCLTVPEKFRRVILYCCIIFGYCKSLDKGGGDYPDFLSKIFCLTVPKTSVRESFVALISGTEAVW